MGCKQSKGISLQDDGNYKQRELKQNPTSPVSLSSASTGDISIPAELFYLADAKPDKLLFHLLQHAAKTADASVWDKVVKLCNQDATAASYVDPETKQNSLHAACSALESSSTIPSSDITPTADAFRALIRCNPESLSAVDANGNIPLHFAIATSTPVEKVDDSFVTRAEILNILIASDYEASMDYLSRNDVFFDFDDDNDEDDDDTDASTRCACTPLYHAISSIPDDFYPAPGPTVAVIRAIHSTNPTMVSIKNASNHDKPLALLYRRFSRQFDLSEKFFPGDNSRQEVLDYRQKYKTAAMNTWKIILSLLASPSKNPEGSGNFFMVHSTVRMDCPPDLLRYIIETQPEEVRQADDMGRLPLHWAAAASSEEGTSGGNGPTPFSAYQSKFVMDELLFSFPDGAAYEDKEGKLPIELAMETNKTWIGGGVKSLYDVYPDAMRKVQVNDYPIIKKALSFSTHFAEEHEEEENTDSNLDKEEHYDAIMMVQKANADLGDVVSAMWANEEDGGVQMLGCIAISQIVERRGNTPSQVLPVALTAVTTVVNAMKNHPNEPAVQEKACNALVLLSPADNRREVSFAASGAAASIVAAMQSHVNDAIVQQEACMALRNIVRYGGSDRATVIASVSGFTALQNALGAHPTNLGVQMEACLAMEALTAFPDANLPDLPGAQTAPLLEAAASRFPEHCKKSAEIVLSRLS